MQTFWPGLVGFWRWVRWPVYVVLVLYAALVIYRAFALGEEERTAAAVKDIQSRHITLADVMGTALPPVPSQAESDSSVEGLDKNNNGIRDDVELAIFALHPNETKVRAAELQYAMTEQMFLTKVFNKETWVAVAEADSRADFCLSTTYPRDDLKKFNQEISTLESEVRELVFNTEIRRKSKEDSFQFSTSHSLINTNSCDVSIDSLPD